MARHDRLRQIQALDPERDFVRIYRMTSMLEFPWDTTQALSFALFRTYGVPSIGRLLARTAEFTERTQKRYDDTTLILDTVLEHGTDSVSGRTAIRRMNQMHGAYPISNEELRYVLATFVVAPIRWIDRYGWRPLVEQEKIAMANYYRDLGRYMGIRDLPGTYQEFGELLDGYERDHFGFDPGGRAVADATLDLLATFWPFRLLPRPMLRRVACGLMDDPLLDAFRLPRPSRRLRLMAETGLRARSRFVRLTRPRRVPTHARESVNVRSYPDGYRVAELGTFPRGCPVVRGEAPPAGPRVRRSTTGPSRGWGAGHGLISSMTMVPTRTAPTTRTANRPPMAALAEPSSAPTMPSTRRSRRSTATNRAAATPSSTTASGAVPADPTVAAANWAGARAAPAGEGGCASRKQEARVNMAVPL
jgi:hypothetical protein